MRKRTFTCTCSYYSCERIPISEIALRAHVHKPRLAHFVPRIAEESVIPVFLDDSKFPGIPHDIVGIKFTFDANDPDWKRKATDEIIIKLIDKLSE